MSRTADGYGTDIHIPDVTGFKLEQAQQKLTDSGIGHITVTCTAAPRLRDKGFDGSSRVVRQMVLKDGTLELLVCNMNV